MDETYSARPDRTGSELVDDEAVVIDFETNHYYCLNPTATVVWSLLTAGPRTVEDVARALGAGYDRSLAEVRDDVERLLANLVEEGLLEKSGSGADGMPVAGLEATGSYVVPRFDKFGTLEQLMLAGE